MLRPSALRQLLSQVTAGTIQATIIATKSGEYLDFVMRKDLANNLPVLTNGQPNQQQQLSNNSTSGSLNVKNVCAIICSVYQSYQKLSVPLDDNLNFLIIDCDIYRLIVRPVGNHLICICADSNTGLGILKLKINSLAESLSCLLKNSLY